MNSTSKKLRAIENPPQYTKNIPDGIILQICSSLPAKSIGRFRCVSNSWKSLLSEPQFIKTHLNRIKNFPNEEHQSLIIVSDDSDSLFLTHFRTTKLTFDDHPFEVERVVRCMVSCDGLVKDANDKLLLVNPTTREIREVPPSPYPPDHPYHTIVYGLGYDSVSDDYKVVTVSFKETDYEHDCTDMYVDVYYVRNVIWKGPQHFPCGHIVDFELGVFLHGCIHWVANRSSDQSSVILAFDLGEEKFHEVPPPPSLNDDFIPAAFGGCLCLYPMGIDGLGFESDILVMNEYGVKESWTKFTIFYRKAALFQPICLLGKEQVVLVKQSTNEKLVVCNLDDGTFKDIVTQGIPEESIAIGNYLESLVSPHYNN